MVPLLVLVAIHGCVALSGGDALAAKHRATKASVKVEPLTDKPKADPRTYELAELSNGIKAVLVHDPQATQSAFSVAVEAGQFNEPRKILGLAHFCEHMLFLGTDSFPDPKGFESFTDTNGGQSNAYTAHDITDYFVTVSSKASKEGFKRFADFFRAPRFNRSFVDKEINAIQSEHDKNVQDPTWRIQSVMYSLANTQSQVSQFHTGTKQTIIDWPKGNGTDTVEALKLYFRDNYCAKRMRVASFGPESLDAQLKALKANMADIGAGNAACTATSHEQKPNPWPPGSLGKFVAVKNVQPDAKLWIHFPLADVSDQYLALPMSYIEHVISYEGEGSFSRQLQDDLGLVTNIGMMNDPSSAGTEAFVIAHLTAKGRKHPEMVLDLFFAYLAKLRHHGVDKKLYESLGDASKLNWNWAEPKRPFDLVPLLSERLTRMDPKHVLAGDDRIDMPNSQVVESLIRSMTPDNMNVAFMAPEALQQVNASKNQVLPFYGIDYNVDEFDSRSPGLKKDWLQWLAGSHTEADIAAAVKRRLVAAKLLEASSSFGLARFPPVIEGVPKTLSTDNMHADVVAYPRNFGTLPHKGSDATSLTETVMTSSRQQFDVNSKHGGVDTWFRRGWVSSSPTLQMKMAFRELAAPNSPDDSGVDDLKLSLFGALMGEELNPKMVDLVATGNSYSVSTAPGELSFSFSGFPPMMPQLTGKVLDVFNSFTNGTVKKSALMQKRFDRIVESQREALTTFSEMPFRYAMSDVSNLLRQDYFSREETLTALSNLSLDAVLSSVSDDVFSKPLKLSSLIMGNVNEVTADSIVKGVTNAIQVPDGIHVPAPVANGAVERMDRVLKLNSAVEARRWNPRAGDTNSVALVSFMGDVASVESRVALSVLSSVLQTVSYSHLRTEMQLGYVVFGWASMMSNVEYLSVVVQGDKLSADETEAAIENVLTELMPKKLKEMSDSEFQSLRSAFLQTLKQAPTGPSQEFGHFWMHVNNGAGCFNLRDTLMEYTNKSFTDKKLLIETFERLTKATTPGGLRRKYTVKYVPKPANAAAATMPVRPTLAEAKAMWTRQGVKGAAIDILAKEYEHGEVIDKVDSETRKKFLKAGGYYPDDFACRLKATATATDLLEEESEAQYLVQTSLSRRPHRDQHEHISA